MADDVLPGGDVLDEPAVPVVPDDPGDAGPPPAVDVAPADAPPTPPTPGDDEPPGSTEGEDPEDWRYLTDRYHKLKGNEFKAAVGKTFLEKQRYATEQRERADGLSVQLEQERAERAKPAEPPQPHPDVERIEARITSLKDRDDSLFARQEKALLAISQCNEEAAVAKHQANEADEDNRSFFEDQVARLTDRKSDLHDRFKELQQDRQENSFKLEEAKDQRTWTQRVVEDQTSREDVERKSRAKFDEDFPSDITDAMSKVADGLKIEAVDREALKDFVLPRLAVQFWKLGQSESVDDVDVKALIETEVRRWHKTQDTKARAEFRKDSEKRLAGRTPPASPKPPAETPPKGPSVPQPTGVKEVTALGLQDTSPTMLKAREYLDGKGL